MRDFERYSKELYLNTKNFNLESVLKSYNLPNFDDLHNMICRQGVNEFNDTFLYDRAEYIDYSNYEKELWNLENLKQ